MRGYSDHISLSLAEINLVFVQYKKPWLCFVLLILYMKKDSRSVIVISISSLTQCRILTVCIAIFKYGETMCFREIFRKKTGITVFVQTYPPVMCQDFGTLFVPSFKNYIRFFWVACRSKYDISACSIFPYLTGHIDCFFCRNQIRIFIRTQRVLSMVKGI